MSEHLEQCVFFQWLKLNERQYPVLSRFFAIPNGGQRNIKVATKLKREGVKKGVLDTCLPVARRGKIGLWIEFKTGKNKLTHEQQEWKEFLESENHEVHIIYSWTDAARITIAYLDMDVTVR